MENHRTNKQNKALHLLFQMLADSLNESGLDMRKTLREGVEIPWSKDTVKDYLWRPIQQAQIKKKSTTEMTTTEIDKVFDTLNRHLGERFELHVDFPSVQQIINRQIDEESRKQ